MLPNVPGAMGNNPMPKPVAKNIAGSERTSFNLIFIVFQLLLITAVRLLLFRCLYIGGSKYRITIPKSLC